MTGRTDTPYAEATDWIYRSSDYDAARMRLDDECSGRNDPPSAPASEYDVPEVRFLKLLGERGIPFEDGVQRGGPASAV